MTKIIQHAVKTKKQDEKKYELSTFFPSQDSTENVQKNPSYFMKGAFKKLVVKHKKPGRMSCQLRPGLKTISTIIFQQ